MKKVMLFVCALGLLSAATQARSLDEQMEQEHAKAVIYERAFAKADLEAQADQIALKAEEALKQLILENKEGECYEYYLEAAITAHQLLVKIFKNETEKSKFYCQKQIDTLEKIASALQMADNQELVNKVVDTVNHDYYFFGNPSNKLVSLKEAILTFNQRCIAFFDNRPTAGLSEPSLRFYQGLQEQTQAPEQKTENRKVCAEKEPRLHPAEK